MYDSETMIWRKKERSRNRTVKKDDLRGLFGIRRIDKFQNARIRIRKRLMKVFSDGSTMWRECRNGGLLRGSLYGKWTGSSVGRLRKRWMDTVKACLK